MPRTAQHQSTHEQGRGSNLVRCARGAPPPSLACSLTACCAERVQIAGKRSYNELAAHCFGKPGRNVVDVSISVMNLGSLVRWYTWVEQQQQAGRL